MAKYVCSVCGYVYDEKEGCPEMGIAPGTKWEDIDEEEFTCPACGAAKAMFDKAEE
jgi:rubredoxin